ncbi:hypothetical protein, partial [Helicobacter pylori]|uniref:hypothetical protein n=1 Tax=Helicobacter pylori TaxID=210 RepID=UPI0029298D87
IDGERSLGRLVTQSAPLSVLSTEEKSASQSSVRRVTPMPAENTDPTKSLPIRTTAEVLIPMVVYRAVVGPADTTMIPNVDPS